LGERAAVERFFEDRAAARQTFESIRAFMATCGPMRLAPAPSRVSFLARTRFLWVQEAHLDGSVTVGFLLPSKVGSPRLRSGDLGSRWSHHAKVHALDGELKSWFKGAYAWDVAGIKDKPVKVRSRPSRRRTTKAVAR
jgi:hypothetical protein